MSLWNILSDPTTHLNMVVRVSALLRQLVLSFDGSGDYVTFGNVLNKGAADSFTAEIVFAATAGVGTQRTLMGKGSTGARWSVHITSGDLFQLLVSDGTNTASTTLSATPWLDSREHRLSVVVNRTTQTICGYVDGLKVIPEVSISAVGSLSNAVELRTGSRGDNVNYYIGKLRDFRMWSVARSAAQIDIYKRARAVVGTEVGLDLYAPYDEGIGSRVVGRTVSAHVGSVVGAAWVTHTKTFTFACHADDAILDEDPQALPFLVGVSDISDSMQIDHVFGVDPLVGDNTSYKSPVDDSREATPGPVVSSSSPGVIHLLHAQPSSGDFRMSDLQDYSFAGQRATVYVGVLGTAFSSYYPYTGGVISTDPSLALNDEGISATLPMSSPLTRLESLDLNPPRYVGIPHCFEVMTTTGVASTSYNAAHDLRSYTLMGRFSVASAPAAARNIIAKSTGSTANNFTLNFQTTGALQFLVSLGGVSTVFFTTSDTYADGLWHTWVVGLLNLTTSYLMIDNVVVDTYTPTASADLPATGILLARFLVGKHVDYRVYNHYKTPAEAIVASSARVGGDELGLVGYWRMDDNAGGTINDYSATGADATITGVVNTDYRWAASKLGEPELAGRPYPLIFGQPFNVRAHLIDQTREIYRVHESNPEDSGLSYPRQVSLRARGVALVETTDWVDGADGTYTMVSAEDEPVTADVVQQANTLDYNVDAILYEILGRQSAVQADSQQRLALSGLWRWAASYATDEDKSLASVIQELLSGVGGHLRVNRTGQLYPDMLLPPIGTGPYGSPCPDFMGMLGYVQWPGLVGVPTTNMTVAAWVKTFVTGSSVFDDPGLDNVRQVILGKGDDWELSIISTSGLSGADTGKLQFKFEDTGAAVWTVKSTKGHIRPGVWHFVAAVFDDTMNQLRLYVGRQGGPLNLVATTTLVTGTPRATGSNVYSGYRLFGSATCAQVWSVVKSQSELLALMQTPPVGNEANLFTYAPMNEGPDSASQLIDLPSSVLGSHTLSGDYWRWSPMLTIDLDQSSSAQLDSLKRLIPSRRVVVRYDRNWTPMVEADIANSVSQSDRIKYTAPYKSVEINRPGRDILFGRTREVILNSTLRFSADAEVLAQILDMRHGEDRFIAEVSLPSNDAGQAAGRKATALKIGDEIFLRGSVVDALVAGRTMRVVRIAASPQGASNTALTLWG